MTGIWEDLRYAMRTLVKGRRWALVAVVALALGIGLSTTIFSILYNGVLRPFPYRDAERLTAISVYDTQKGAQEFRSMYHLDEVAAFRAQNHSFDDIVGYSTWDVVYSQKGLGEQVHGCVLTPNAMDFWGVPPLIGRGLVEQDSQPAATPVVLLNYNFWKKIFHEDQAVLGTTMTLHGHARTIIGVMPPRFALYGADLYIPIAWNRPDPSDPAVPQASVDYAEPVYFFATGIMKRNASPQAAADLQVIAQYLVEHLSYNQVPALAKRHKVETKKDSASAQELLDKQLGTYDESELCKLLLEISLLDSAYQRSTAGRDDGLMDAAKRYRVDTEKLQKTVAKDFTAKRDKKTIKPKVRTVAG